MGRLLTLLSKQATFTSGGVLEGNTEEARFWAKVGKRGVTPGLLAKGMATGCWDWGAARKQGGYGVFWAGRGGTVLAHRWSYEQHVAPIPEGLQVDHLCRNPSCVNPEHLEPVTQRENIMRGNLPVRARAAAGHHHNKLKAHCPSGHPYDELNTYRPPSGRRECRACKRERNACYRRRMA